MDVVTDAVVTILPPFLLLFFFTMGVMLSSSFSYVCSPHIINCTDTFGPHALSNDGLRENAV